MFTSSDYIFSLFFAIALGQIMLYVDGMNGVINHNETIQWLYTLIGSKVRLSKILILYGFGVLLVHFISFMLLRYKLSSKIFHNIPCGKQVTLSSYFFPTVFILFYQYYSFLESKAALITVCCHCT